MATILPERAAAAAAALEAMLLARARFVAATRRRDAAAAAQWGLEWRACIRTYADACERINLP